MKPANEIIKHHSPSWTTADGMRIMLTIQEIEAIQIEALRTALELTFTNDADNVGYILTTMISDIKTPICKT